MTNGGGRGEVGGEVGSLDGGDWMLVGLVGTSC